MSEVSWWPKSSTWLVSHAHRGRWTPDSETWFSTRLQHIAGGTAHMLNATQWRAGLRRTPSPAAFKTAVEVSANAFLLDKLKVNEVDITEG